MLPLELRLRATTNSPYIYLYIGNHLIALYISAQTQIIINLALPRPRRCVYPINAQYNAGQLLRPLENSSTTNLATVVLPPSYTRYIYIYIHISEYTHIRERRMHYASRVRAAALVAPKKAAQSNWSSALLAAGHLSLSLSEKGRAAASLFPSLIHATHYRSL